MTHLKLDPINTAEINCLALRHFGTVMERLTTRYGQPTGEVAQLNPNAKRRLREFRLTDSATGAWVQLADGAQGDDFIAAVEYLADVPRSTAAAFLARILTDIEG